MSRTLVIGDTHGGLKALEQVMERAMVTQNDTLIFLGDYVDGWSDSAKIVSFLIDMQKSHNCLFIRGNHDELCYNWLTKKTNYPEWLKHGGQATIDAYAQLSVAETNQHLVFFEELLNYHIDDQNRLFLHAGFTNLHGPDREYFDEMFYWDRSLWEMALALDPKLDKTALTYPKRLSIFEEIYIGHTPVTRINKTTPVNAACVWNVDTGAAFKGPLTIMDVDSKEIWQSDPVYTLYPNEKGRN